MKGSAKLRQAIGGDLSRKTGNRRLSGVIRGEKPKSAPSRTSRLPKRRSWKLSRESQHKEPEGSAAPGLTAEPAGVMLDEYPSFKAVFAKNPAGVPRCEVLLALDLDEERALREAFAALDEARRRSPSDDDELTAMLSERDFRPHLVAATALAIEGASPKVYEALWRAIDRGSLAGPELAAAASLTDERFEEEARSRIERRCPLEGPLLLPTRADKKRKKRKEKPVPRPSRSPRLLSALLALCRERPGAMGWLAPHLADPEVFEMLSEGADEGGERSLSWRGRLLEALALVAG